MCQAAVCHQHFVPSDIVIAPPAEPVTDVQYSCQTAFTPPTQGSLMMTISFCVPKKGFSDPHIQMRENGNNDRLLLGLCFHVVQIVYGKEQK